MTPSTFSKEKQSLRGVFRAPLMEEGGLLTELPVADKGGVEGKL